MCTQIHANIYFSDCLFCFRVLFRDADRFRTIVCCVSVWFRRRLKFSLWTVIYFVLMQLKSGMNGRHSTRIAIEHNASMHWNQVERYKFPRFILSTNFYVIFRQKSGFLSHVNVLKRAKHLSKTLETHEIGFLFYFKRIWRWSCVPLLWIASGLLSKTKAPHGDRDWMWMSFRR